jgi:hypothetical protein
VWKKAKMPRVQHLTLLTLLCSLLSFCHAKHSCVRLSTEYVSSPNEIIHLADSMAWDLDYCQALTSSNYTVYMAAVASYNAGRKRLGNEALSYFHHVVDCNGVLHHQHDYIEPLFGVLRHPLALNCPTLSAHPQYLYDIDYIIPARNDSAEVALAQYNIYIDLGASTYNDLSQKGLLDKYDGRGIHFDRHLMWEAIPRQGPDILKGVPGTEYHNFQYFNVPAVADVDDPRNPLNVLKTIARPQDFVVLKLDIDNSQLELSFIQQIITRPELYTRIDEFYWEPHFNNRPMIACCWQHNVDTTMSLNTTLHLFLQLRSLGIRAHGWP